MKRYRCSVWTENNEKVEFVGFFDSGNVHFNSKTDFQTWVYDHIKNEYPFHNTSFGPISEIKQ